MYLSTDKELTQVFGEWLATLAEWEWFATFTFRDPPTNQRGWTRVGWKFAHSALRHWGDELQKACFGDKQPRWVALMEYQRWRGVPHWHLLVANVPLSQRRMDWVDWWYKRYGIARVLPYDPALGARYYLAKYLTKEVADIQFSASFAVDRYLLDKYLSNARI